MGEASGSAEARRPKRRSASCSATISASISRSTVMIRSVDPGQLVDPTMALFTLADLSMLLVETDVDEAYATQIATGQVAQVLLTALPDSPMRLRVTRVTPLARSVEGRQRFEVLAQPDGAVPAGWRPGMQGVAQIELAPQPLALRWAQEAWRGLRWMTWSWW